MTTIVALLATFGPALLLFLVLLSGRRPAEAIVIRLLTRRRRPRGLHCTRAIAALPVVCRRPGRELAATAVTRPPPALTA